MWGPDSVIGASPCGNTKHKAAKVASQTHSLRTRHCLSVRQALPSRSENKEVGGQLLWACHGPGREWRPCSHSNTWQEWAVRAAGEAVFVGGRMQKAPAPCLGSPTCGGGVCLLLGCLLRSGPEEKCRVTWLHIHLSGDVTTHHRVNGALLFAEGWRSR